MNYVYKNRDCFFILLLIPVVVFSLGILLISIELLFKSVINNSNLNDFAICVGVFAFSSPILLIVGCNLFHVPWLSGNVTYWDFKNADQIMRIVRFITYVICANNLVLVYAKEECTQNTLLMVMFTISSFALFESVLQSTWQTTFRRRSNYAIAIANTLLYLAMLDLSCDSNTPLLGWISWEKDTNICRCHDHCAIETYAIRISESSKG